MKKRARIKIMALGLGIMLIGILAEFLFGRVDTMAGLFLLAVFLMWQNRPLKERQ